MALGAQKTIENLVGSVVVVADSPVRIGDYCSFGSQSGTVIDIGIRSSRVRTLNRTIVTVPNSDFSSMQIENYTSRDMFHFLHNLYIKRNADIDVVFNMVKKLDQFLDDHELTNQEWNQANILELRQDCYVIQLRAYINAVDSIEFYGKQNNIDDIDEANSNGTEPAEGNLSTDSNNDNINPNSDEQNGIDLSKEADKTKYDKAAAIQENGKAENEKVADEKFSIDRERIRKRKALVKNKFKRAKRKFGFSIWNQP